MSALRPTGLHDAVSEVVEVEVTVEASNPYAHLSDRQICALLARHRPEYREAYREVFGRGAPKRQSGPTHG